MVLGALRFARMAGSSLAAPDAAGWVTDFLERRVLRPARGGARRRRPAPGPRDRDHALGPARPAPADPRRARLPPRLRRRPLPALPAALAHARAAARGGGAAAGRLVRRRVARPGAPRLGRRVHRRGGAGGVRPGGPAARRRARPAQRTGSAAGAAALVDLPAGGAAVGRRGDRDARRHVALARLRLRRRPLHGAAQRRAGGPDVRDRGRRAPRAAHARLHPRLRHRHRPARPGGHDRGGARAGAAGRARAPGRRRAPPPARAHHPRGPLPRAGGVAAARSGRRTAARSSATSASGTRSRRTWRCRSGWRGGRRRWRSGAAAHRRTRCCTSSPWRWRPTERQPRPGRESRAGRRRPDAGAEPGRFRR